MVENKLKIKIKGLYLKTPLVTASGTSGSSDELLRLKDHKKILGSLGAFVTKGVTLTVKKGNPNVRVMPTSAGLLNSIGLQNKGVAAFVENELKLLLKYNLPVFVNISANTIDEFGELAGYLCDNDISKVIAGIEINVSCPNIKEGGVIFGTNPKSVEQIVKTVRRRIDKKVIVITKLTPNITDILVPAKAAINGGTDALSMINTLRGIAINIETQKPTLGNIYGGLSGPAIKPVGLYMVYECFDKIAECKKKIIPIIGIGGIANARDALEYIMAGATAIGIGTAWFADHNIFPDVEKGLRSYLEKNSITSINELIGVAHEKEQAEDSFGPF